MPSTMLTQVQPQAHLSRGSIDAATDEYQQDEVAPLGANVCEALNIVSQLEQLGLDKQDISLPKCIVLGTSEMVDPALDFF